MDNNYTNLCKKCGHKIEGHIWRKFLKKYKCLFEDCYCQGDEEMRKTTHKKGYKEESRD